jgi:hypothetical protein
MVLGNMVTDRSKVPPRFRREDDAGHALAMRLFIQ